MAIVKFTLEQLVFAEKPNNPRFIDLTGKVSGRLTVLGIAENRKNARYWYCKCLCGSVIKVFAGNLFRGNTLSCGCIHHEMLIKRNLTHGKTRTPEYSIYCGMQARCNNPKHKFYKYYGGRGIALDLSFDEFLEEVGNRPSLHHSIDRIDTNRNYERGNIRWATIEEQANNKNNNRFIEAKGENKTCAQWAKTLTVTSKTLSKRIRERGWCQTHAVSLPNNSRKPKDCEKCNPRQLSHNCI